MTTGVAFKIAAVPFHYWTPDAYQGSPTPVTGYLSVGPKVGAFALILRLFVDALGSEQLAGRLAADHRDPRRDDDDARQPRRPRPEQRQADARLQLDRPHRVHARRARRVRRWPDAGPRGAALLRRRVLVHESRRVRRRRRPAEAAGGDERPGHVRRSRPPRTDPGTAHGPVPAVPHRDSADGRVLRQGARDPGGGRGGRLGRDPRGHRRAERGRGRVLLPPGDRLHVHARFPDRCAAAQPRRACCGAGSR